MHELDIMLYGMCGMLVVTILICLVLGLGAAIETRRERREGKAVDLNKQDFRFDDGLWALKPRQPSEKGW